MKISIYHNIMWSKYKGGVFSAIHDATKESTDIIQFTQISETDSDRVELGSVDLSYHRYPHELIFKGSYAAQPTYKLIAALVTRAWKTQADIVILPGYERIEYWAMLVTLIIRRKKIAVFCDSTAFDRPSNIIKHILKRIFFSNCKGFFAYGIRSREYLISHGVPSEKIYFRCQAAALPLDYTERNANLLRNANAPKPETPPRFVYVGRLSHEKGLVTLLNAMSKVVEVHSNAQLNIVGAGPMKDLLCKFINKNNLQKNVHVLGSMSIKELAEQYSSATALVLPSTREPWGLVVNEALSYGCPCIVSNVCGCTPELIISNKTGFVFQCESIIDLAEKMLAAPTAFKNTSETAENCIQHISKYSPSSAAKQIIEGCKIILNQMA